MPGNFLSEYDWAAGQRSDKQVFFFKRKNDLWSPKSNKQLFTAITVWRVKKLIVNELPSQAVEFIKAHPVCVCQRLQDLDKSGEKHQHVEKFEILLKVRNDAKVCKSWRSGNFKIVGKLKRGYSRYRGRRFSRE